MKPLRGTFKFSVLLRSGGSLLAIRLFGGNNTEKTLQFPATELRNSVSCQRVTTEKQVNRPTRGKQRKAKAVIVNQFFLCLRVTLFMLEMFYLSSDCCTLQ